MFLVSQQLTDSHISIGELQDRFNNDDHSIPRKIIRMGANLVNSDPYWNKCKRELDAFTFYRRHVKKDLPCYFQSASIAEFHWIGLKLLLAKYLSAIDSKGESVETYLKKMNDMHFNRQIVLQNLHIVTLYFQARTINFYNTVGVELFNADDYWFRFEFAKSRGQIHSHGVLFSENHYKF